jgi:hypothetical protein
LRREFGWKPIEFTHALNARIAAEAQIQRNSLLISLLAGKFAAETGSQMTASSGRQSGLYKLKAFSGGSESSPEKPAVTLGPVQL